MNRNRVILITNIATIISLFYVFNSLLESRKPETIYVAELVSTLSQTDPRLVRYVREHHLTPPSAEAYNLANPNVDPGDWVGLTPTLRRLLKNMTGGFFLEAGSNDGEVLSSTLGFERYNGWTGLMVEPSPIELVNLKAKHRKAWIADVCLSVVPTPHSMSYLHRINYSIASKFGTVEEADLDSTHGWKHYVIPCFPLLTILKALEITTVDYFNLDVEGVELEVLKTIPFKEVFIRTISVELHTSGDLEKSKLKSFMALQGYKLELDKHPEYVFSHKNL